MAPTAPSLVAIRLRWAVALRLCSARPIASMKTSHFPSLRAVAACAGLALNAHPSGAQAAAAEPPPPLFEFHDQDRVALVGDTLIERERLCGFVETAVTAYSPEHHVIFRNLGWSADNPLGQSRASFDWNKAPDEWFKLLTNQIAAVRPTVVVIGYGMADSFSGADGLGRFRENIGRLVGAVRGLTGPQPPRFVFLGPIRHEKLGGMWLDPQKHNVDLKLYSEAIRELARDAASPFIPLYDLLGDGAQKPARKAYTSNGIHLNDYGYWRAAEAVHLGLRWELNSWRLGVTDKGELHKGSHGIAVSGLERTPTSVRFDGRLGRLPIPLPSGSTDLPSSMPPVMLQFAGMEPGKYTLKIDGETVLTHTAEEWGRGRILRSGPDFGQAERLRQVILRKNELFFHRWRPANSTYLFGFRKHEQGQNAREIPMFDPLIDAEEKEISRLRQPGFGGRCWCADIFSAHRDLGFRRARLTAAVRQGS